MTTINLQLSVEKVNTILAVLGEMPTKSGLFPLAMEIKGQADQQMAPQGITVQTDEKAPAVAG